MWRPGVPTDLGSVEGLSGEATLIANDGTIFGVASTRDGNCCSSVVLGWKHGRLIDLGRFGATSAQPIAVNAHDDLLVETELADQSTVGLLLVRDGKTIRVKVPALGHQHLYGVGLDDEGDVVGYGLTTQRGFMWRNGRATLLPRDVGPRAVAGGWIIGTNGSTGDAVLLRLHR